MRYLVTMDDHPPFFTYIFEPENHFILDCDMHVYDLVKQKYTIDGYNWFDIEEDCL